MIKKILITIIFIAIYACSQTDITLGYYYKIDTVNVINDTIIEQNELIWRFERHNKCVYLCSPRVFIRHKQSIDEEQSNEGGGRFEYEGNYKVKNDSIKVKMKIVKVDKIVLRDSVLTLTLLRIKNCILRINDNQIFQWSLK
jgi:hypothetical protein